MLNPESYKSCEYYAILLLRRVMLNAECRHFPHVLSLSLTIGCLWPGMVRTNDLVSIYNNHDHLNVQHLIWRTVAIGPNADIGDDALP